MRAKTDDLLVHRIVQLSRRLEGAGALPACQGIYLRNFSGSGDIDRWIALRRAAFDVVGAGGRQWTAADFAREFLGKSDWSPERMWLAETDQAGARRRTVGAVCLGIHGTGTATKGVVRWLMVVPDFRRRGVGRLLMSALEADCWRRGLDHVTCETHSDWAGAIALYKSLGYTED